MHGPWTVADVGSTRLAVITDGAKRMDVGDGR